MEPVPAATIILLAEPLEVLMVKRSSRLAFMADVWVFPGGRVEPADTSPEAAARRELTEEAGVALAPDAELVPFARWVTPVGPPRRFDTWFYLARASDLASGPAPRADGSEVVDLRWITPAAALAEPGTLAFPTIHQLRMLEPHTSVDSVVRASRGLEIVTVLPELGPDGEPFIRDR